MQKQSYISRRNFVGGTMAFAAGIALTNIEGNIFSATPAHATQGSQDIKNATQDAQGTFGAQDTGGAGGALTESGAQTNIIVVRPTELGIVAYDLTDAKNPMAVPDCHVTITSRYNKKSIEGTTNAEGKVVLDIAALAEENSDSDIYAFNGSIEVRKEGYREVNIPLARICGHNAFVAPTRPLNNLPYFRSLTFNEWDVQYMAPEFLTSASNTETHKIQGALWLPDGLNIQQASLVKSDDGTEQTIGTFNIFRTGFLNKNIVCEILGDFLNSGKDVCLGEGSDPKIVFGSTENMFETAINIDSKPAVAEE